jgi:hypothetical protein
MVTVEVLCWAAPLAFACASSLGVLAWCGVVSDSSAWFGARTICAALLGSALGAAVGGATNRESDLFAFFQRRT